MQGTTLHCCFTLLLLVLLSACGQPAKLTPLRSDAVILAFGDSLTYGTGAAKAQSYPAVLAAITGRKVINAGVPGEVTAAGLERLSRLLKQYDPDLLILCHGGNDILRKLNLAQTKNNLQQMVQLAKAQNTDVILIGVPKLGIFLSALPMYADLAETANLPIENDIIAHIEGSLSLKSDHIHPNAAGYRKMAEAIVELMIDRGAL
ncbi:MAG: arylesterase [Gammaproteobacteria bacterium]|nr:arylesterase [Gammaproteobacteria bacterium]